MAGSPIYDKMVKEKGFDPHTGSIYDRQVRKATPEEKSGKATKATAAKTKAAPKTPSKPKAGAKSPVKPKPKGGK